MHQSICDLESRCSLSHEIDPFASIGLRRTDIHVMRHVLDTRDLGFPRLGHPDREDGNRAFVVAVGGMDGEAVVSPAGRLPSAFMTDRKLVTNCKGRETCLHLYPG